jgi:uroporphyrinogen decarboxylase
MNSRERVDAALAHQEADRIAIHDAPWSTAIARWHKEGLPEDTSPAEYFGYELRGAGADLTFHFEPEVIEETDEYTISRNANGAIRKNWRHMMSTPECLEFTITDRASWDRHKHRLEVTKDHINWDALAGFNQSRAAGYWCSFNAAMGYDKTQGIVGSENLLMSMITDPDWVLEMFMTSAEMICQAAQIMIDGGFEFDGAFFYDDMGYRNTGLFSPDMYRRLLMPAHALACSFFHDRGLKVILHSCGCVNEIVPDIIAAGVNCLQPLEVKAGMDVVELKREYGKDLAFMGGIDVRNWALEDSGPTEDELRTKIPVAMEDGGYIFHSDHSVPDNVSFQRYERVIEIVRELGRY